MLMDINYKILITQNNFHYLIKDSDGEHCDIVDMDTKFTYNRFVVATVIDRVNSGVWKLVNINSLSKLFYEVKT
jgi:hypothetical protein